jgi:predicted homoserine dehydrogenase-like protein
VSIEKAEVAAKEKLIPAGLAKGCVLKHAVPTGAEIAWDMLAEVKPSKLLELRRDMDAGK